MRGPVPCERQDTSASSRVADAGRECNSLAECTPQLPRTQLATYLRPMGAKCPAIYGGGYDRPWQPADAETTAA